MKHLKDIYSYTALFEYAEDGINIEFPDLPGCYPCADPHDTDMAIKNAKEALGLHLFGMEQDGEEIPAPTPPNEIEYRKGQIPVIVEVFMPPVRDRIKNRFVKKTLSLPAWLAAQAEEANVNCSKLFQNALINYLDLRKQDF